MSRKILNQKGFSVVETVLLVVIAGLLAGVGWYVYDSNRETQDRLDKIEQTSDQTPVAESAKAGEKFVFKELGISITLPKELEGLSYKYEANIKSAYLNTTAFAEAYEKCYGEKIDPNYDSFGAIGRGEGQYQPPVDGPGGGTLIKQLDKFYIDGSLPNGLTTCTQPGVDEGLVQDESRRLFDKVAEAVKSATVVE